MTWFFTAVHHFLHHTLEAAPWLVGGAFLGITIERWLKPEWAERWLQSGHLPVLSATAAGALLPGCAMATIPVATSLRNKGAGVGTLTAFIMIAPILSPHTIVLNAALLGWPMTVGRMVLPVLLSIGLGWALNAAFSRRAQNRQPPVASPSPASSCCCQTAQPPPATGNPCCSFQAETETGRPPFLTAVVRCLRDLLPYFLVGLAAVSVLEALIPHETIARYIRSGWTACVIAAAAGIPLYVCDGAEVPLTLALIKLGAGQGPAFAFLLSSVGTCLPTIVMARRIIGTTATAVYVAAWLVLAIGGGMAMGAMLPP